MNIADLLSVNTVMFTVLDYPMSYVEFFGTVLNLLSVWLVARKNIWTWPVGIVAVILFGVLFYQIRLYADFIEQIYYLITCIYGWWFWQRRGAAADCHDVGWSSPRATSIWILGTVLVSYGSGFLIRDLHLLAPSLFPEAASYPFVDAFTTVASFAAMILMAHRRIECWIYWLVIDVIGVWLYYAKGVVLVNGLYGIFLVLAALGLYHWIRSYQGAVTPPPGAATPLPAC